MILPTKRTNNRKIKLLFLALTEKNHKLIFSVNCNSALEQVLQEELISDGFLEINNGFVEITIGGIYHLKNFLENKLEIIRKKI